MLIHHQKQEIMSELEVERQAALNPPFITHVHCLQPSGLPHSFLLTLLNSPHAVLCPHRYLFICIHIL